MAKIPEKEATNIDGSAKMFGFMEQFSNSEMLEGAINRAMKNASDSGAISQSVAAGIKQLFEKEPKTFWKLADDFRNQLGNEIDYNSIRTGLTVYVNNLAQSVQSLDLPASVRAIFAPSSAAVKCDKTARGSQFYEQDKNGNWKLKAEPYNVPAGEKLGDFIHQNVPKLATVIMNNSGCKR